MLKIFQCSFQDQDLICWQVDQIYSTLVLWLQWLSIIAIYCNKLQFPPVLWVASNFFASAVLILFSHGPGGPEIGASLQWGSPCSVAGAQRRREGRRAVAASAALDGPGAEWVEVMTDLQWIIDIYSLYMLIHRIVKLYPAGLIDAYWCSLVIITIYNDHS